MARNTPLFDAWLEKFRARMESRGRKAQAAAFLAEHLGWTAESARVSLHRILSGRELPNAEIVLALDGWKPRKGK